MARTSKADKSTGENYDVKVSPALRERLKKEFNQKYRRGKQILQVKFQIDWGDTSDTSDPPTDETVRKFFSGKTETCKYWFIDGLCRLLLGCSYDEASKSPTDTPSKPTDEPESASTVPSQFQALIEDKTKDFVGREFVFTAIEHFLRTQPNGYFTISGDPGMGKSAILAKYVQDTGCVAHFNVRLRSINRTDQFLESVCTQLIDNYDLPYSSLPVDVTRDGKFLTQLLEEVSDRLGENQRLVIAIDALDEVDFNSQDAGANILYLPESLPPSVYFILTRRAVTLPLTVHTPQHLFDLMTFRDESLQDVQTYIRRATEREQLRTWIDRQQLTVEEFVTQLAEKSENNFMYLRYVLADIERGVYRDLSIDRLPKGLEAYYEDHWRLMGMTAKPLPRDKIKIVYVLVEIGHPVSRQLISECASEDQLTVQDVLDEWEQFLHEQEMEAQICYSVYHGSFADFLHRKDIVQAAEVEIKKVNTLIADDLWEGLFGDE